MLSLSFDGLVGLYDETRTFNVACFDGAMAFLTERLPLPACGRVFEPGIGSGRIALPLAERGYAVTGVDISREMLGLLAARLPTRAAAGRVACARGDVCELPFADGCFDWAVAVHLFWFVAGWQRAARELLRVVRPTGSLVLMSTGTGAEVPWLNERYKSLCAEAGHPIVSAGARSTADVLDYYRGLGCRMEQVRDRWCWTARIPYARAIAYVAARAYSFTAAVPEAVHAAAVRGLEREVSSLPGGLEAVAEVPNQISLAFMSQANGATGAHRGGCI